MAEVAASIIGISTFGIKLTLTLYDFGCTTASAKQQTDHIAKHVTLYSNVLELLAERLEADVPIISEAAIDLVEELYEQSEELFDRIKALLPRKDAKDEISFLRKIAWNFKKSKIDLLVGELEYLKSTTQLLVTVIFTGRRIQSYRKRRSTVGEQMSRTEREAMDAQCRKAQVVIVEHMNATEQLPTLQREDDRSDAQAIEPEGGSSLKANSTTAVTLVARQTDVISRFQDSLTSVQDASQRQALVLQRSTQLLHDLLLQWTRFEPPNKVSASTPAEVPNNPILNGSAGPVKEREEISPSKFPPDDGALETQQKRSDHVTAVNEDKPTLVYPSARLPQPPHSQVAWDTRPVQADDSSRPAMKETSGILPRDGGGVPLPSSGYYQPVYQPTPGAQLGYAASIYNYTAQQWTSAKPDQVGDESNGTFPGISRTASRRKQLSPDQPQPRSAHTYVRDGEHRRPPSPPQPNRAGVSSSPSTPHIRGNGSPLPPVNQTNRALESDRLRRYGLAVGEQPSSTEKTAPEYSYLEEPDTRVRFAPRSKPSRRRKGDKSGEDSAPPSAVVSGLAGLSAILGLKRRTQEARKRKEAKTVFEVKKSRSRSRNTPYVGNWDGYDSDPYDSLYDSEESLKSNF